jgi:hypothetical protein
MKRVGLIAAALLLAGASFNEASALGWRWRCSSYCSSGYYYYPSSCSYYPGNYQNYGYGYSGYSYPTYGYGSGYGYGPGGYPGPSIMNILGMNGLGGPSTGQSMYMSLPVGIGYGQTGYLQVPVGNTSGRASYLQMPVNTGYGPPTFMQIELGRNSSDVAPSPRPSSNATPPTPGPGYGSDTSALDKLTASRVSADDDVPTIVGPALASDKALVKASRPQADETAGIQFVSTSVPTKSAKFASTKAAPQSSSTSFSLSPKTVPMEPAKNSPSLPQQDEAPWIVK